MKIVTPISWCWSGGYKRWCISRAWPWCCPINGSYNYYHDAGEAEDEMKKEEEDAIMTPGKQSLELILGPFLKCSFSEASSPAMNPEMSPPCLHTCFTPLSWCTEETCNIYEVGGSDLGWPQPWLTTSCFSFGDNPSHQKPLLALQPKQVPSRNFKEERKEPNWSRPGPGVQRESQGWGTWKWGLRTNNVKMQEQSGQWEKGLKECVIETGNSPLPPFSNRPWKFYLAHGDYISQPPL